MEADPPLVTAHLSHHNANNDKLQAGTRQGLPTAAQTLNNVKGWWASLTHRTKVIIVVVAVVAVVAIAAGAGGGAAASKKKSNSNGRTEPSSSSSPTVAQVEGILRTYSVHAGGAYGLQLANSSVVRLEQVPIASYTQTPVPVGSAIRVTCTLVGNWSEDGDGVKCTNASSVQLVRTTSAQASRQAVPYTGSNQGDVVKWLIIPIAACEYEPSSLGVNEIRGFIQNAATELEMCSYKRMLIDMEALKVRQTIQFGCTARHRQMMESCNYNMLWDMVNMTLSIEEQSFYTNYMLLLPDALLTSGKCDFLALADVLGPVTWFFGADKSIKSVGTVMQELIHNFGLAHGNRDAPSDDGRPVCECHFGKEECPNSEQVENPCHTEYGDNSTPMGGNEKACLSAPEMFRMNWATALAKLDRSSLQAGVSVQYMLPATFLTNKGNMVIVSPNWKTPYDLDIYFSLRGKGGGDATLDDEFAGKLNVHVQSQTMVAAEQAGDALTHIVRTVDPDSSWDWVYYKLVVQTGAVLDDKLELMICRYQKDASECSANGDGGGDGSGGCVDLLTDCTDMAKAGYCNKPEFTAYMFANCKQACGQCTTCEDNAKAAADCATYKATYGCGDSGDSYYVSQICPKTCGLCSSGGGRAVLPAAAPGRQCVDLNIMCAAYKQQIGCNPDDPDDQVFMGANCQATCQSCAPDSQGTSVDNEVPLGCATNYDITGVQPIKTIPNLEIDECYTQCWNDTNCFFFSYKGDGTCAWYEGLQQVIADPDAKLAPDAAATMCAMGYRSSPHPKPEQLTQLFYCVSGLDIQGSLLDVGPVQSEAQCAQACVDSAYCLFYVLLKDNTCVLKSDIFSGRDGTTQLRPDVVDVTCIQTAYIPDAQTQRRRQMMQAVANNASAVNSLNISIFSILSTWSKPHHLPRPLKVAPAAAK